MVKKKKAQVWSTDLIAGVLIFLLISGIFYAFLNKQASNDTKKIELESELASNKILSNSKVSITEDNTIKDEKLIDLASNITQSNPNFDYDYQEIKKELGIKGDFCLILQNQEGNIITIKDNENNSYIGIGNPNLNISGQPCGQKIQ